jgi:3-oxoacyl-(acyl-carrier-protein) synthase
MITVRIEPTLQDRIQALVESGQLSSEDGADLLRHAAQAGSGPSGSGPSGPGPAPDRAPDDGAIAIVGIGLSLPGAGDLDELAGIFRDGRVLVEPIPDERVDLALSAAPELAAYLPEPAERARDPRAYGSWLRGIEQFDPRPFGLDDHEATFLGPAERIFLQVADRALASAGQRREQLRGSATGVFAAYTPYPMFEYLQMFPDMDERAFVCGIPATLPYHLAYRLDLRGPVLAVNTTCSSSLAAVHLAKQALRAGECDLAVVAGVGVRIFPFNDTAPDHIVQSKRWRCSPFSAEADGIIGGEGVVAIVVKRLADAIRDRDLIHAVVAGSAMKSDGASNGLQAPNPDAQVEVISAALADARTTAAQVGYVEAHGTGTQLGDLVEMDALNRVYLAGGVPVGGCRLGSAKASFGHLGDCAGLLGLLAALTCLRTGTIHGIAGLAEPSTVIRWAESPFVPGRSAVPWPRPEDGSPRRAGISSFGISGTNVHVILHDAPPVSPARAADGTGTVTPVLISARSRRALLSHLEDLHRHLAGREPQSLADITTTLTARRDHGPSRAALLVRDHDGLVTALERISQLRNFERVPAGFAVQGIYLADEPRARPAATAAVGQYRGPLTGSDRQLVTEFLSGQDAGRALRDRFGAGRVLDLPVEPPVTRAIWPRGQAHASAVDDLFYDLAWRPSPDVIGERGGRPGSWLLAGDAGDDVVAAMAAQLAARGDRVIGVVAAGGYRRLGAARYQVDPAAPDSWAAVLDDLGDDIRDDLTAVVYAVGLSDSGPPAIGSPQVIEQRLASHSYGVFGLARAIARSGITHPLRAAVVSSNAERIGPGDLGDADATRLAGFGVVKVLSQELPTLRHVVVDHDLTGTAAAVAGDLIAEVDGAAVQPDEHVAFRGGQRYLQRVIRQRRRPGTPTPVRAGGTYVVAGGTGYLGPQVASFLAGRGAGTVVLLSRTGLPERASWDELAGSDDPAEASQYRTLLALEDSETRVVSLRCDVTDPGQVARVLGEIRAGYGPVAGCFMLTKQLYQLWLHELTSDQFAAGMRNRVHGVCNLARELDPAELDFLVLFSSISSLIGTKGASECCAVNQFLDAIGAQLTARGIRTAVMNWTLILDDISEFAGDSPIPPISFSQFHGAMRRFFDDGSDFAIIAHIDPAEAHRLRPVLKLRLDDAIWDEISAAVSAASTSPSTSTSVPAPVASPAASPLTPDEVRRTVRQLWLDVLGPAPVADTVSFFTAGGTSLNALRLVKLLRDALPEPGFEIADLYNNPTIAEQAEFLTRPDSGPASGPQPETAWTGDLDDLLDAVSSGALSPQQAALTLAPPRPVR